MGKVGYCPSEETRKKIGDANRGRKKPEGWGDRHSEKMKAHYKAHPPEPRPKFTGIITEELLRDLYVADRMSIRKVAEFCGVGHTCIRHYLMMYGIERRARNTPLAVESRRSKGAKLYRKLAFDVYGFEKKCSVCGDEGETNYLVIHHLNKDRYDNSKENLTVLCNACHSRMHRVLESFEKKLSSDQEVLA